MNGVVRYLGRHAFLPSFLPSFLLLQGVTVHPPSLLPSLPPALPPSLPPCLRLEAIIHGISLRGLDTLFVLEGNLNGGLRLSEGGRDGGREGGYEWKVEDEMKREGDR